jgi:hypothetical protein
LIDKVPKCISIKLLLFALLIGLSALNASAVPVDEGGRINSNGDLIPDYHPHQITDEAAPTPDISHMHNWNDVHTGTNSASSPLVTPATMETISTVLFYVYLLVWAIFILPELWREKIQRKVLSPDFLSTPLLKNFTIICTVISTIVGLINGCNQPVLTASDHFMMPILCGAGGAIFGVISTIFPLIVAAVFAFLFVMCSAGLGWIWIQKLWNSVFNRS